MGWSTAAAWFGVALIGQVAALQTIDAGPRVHYQHHIPIESLFALRPWVLAILGLQAALVAIALSRTLRRRVDLRRVPRVPLALAVLITGSFSAAVSPDALRFVSELAFAFFLQLLSLATIVLMVLSVPSPALSSLEPKWRRLFGDDGTSGADAGGVRDQFPWIAAVVAFLLSAILATASYERHPHLPDEVVYVYQARYFADGRLTMPPPLVPAAFDLDLMHYDADRWFSPVSPGWPAVLALGVLVGVPWLVNPVLTAINVLLAYKLLAQLYTRRTARYATVLLSVSPWFLFLGMSLMTHTVTLTCALVAGVAILRARRTASIGAGLLAGAAVGATSLLRPLDGVIVGTLIAGWAIGIGGRRLAIGPLVGLAIGTIALGALVFPYNQALTGDALTFPINAYADKYHTPNANDYGFGPDRGLGWPIDPNPGHGPVDGLINASLNVFGLNTDLFGWGTGSLILVFYLLGVSRMERSDRLMLAVIFVVVVAYFFYYFSGGPDFGARYWFPIIVPLVALSARGIHALERLGGIRVSLGVTALIALSLLTYVPWRAVDKYHHFRGMRPDIRHIASMQQWSGDLILISGERFPDYASAAVHNPIDLTSSSTIYAWDRSEDVRIATIRAYPGRRVWLLDGPSVTGSGYRIAQGPLPASALTFSRGPHQPATVSGGEVPK